MSCCHTRRLLFRVLLDLITISLVASGILIIQGTKPYHRGFFCDDESIQYPLLSNTVPMQLAVYVGISVPVAVIALFEFTLRNSHRADVISLRNANTGGSRSWLIATYSTVAVFIFGMAVTQFLTDMAKFSLGRLRPHFLALCNPDFSKFNCSDGYITADVCTFKESFTAMDARLSFPSGHSSFSMYCMLYVILYLQARIVCKIAVLLKPFVQLVFFSLSFFTCLSRISDYMHHWSDVLAGAVLGIVVCVCVVLSLTDFGQYLFHRGSVCEAESQPPVSSSSQDVEEGSGTPFYGSTSYKHLESQEQQRLLQPGQPK
ncbi:unnamed protein product [Candidula unifasciata]|uniref:Phosphatidic acid phosphatase type 2/haloperoxidase domain-containing protein n=1 Tax=Candidula unifasciata TaxID=100452 RepID=A0A8S3ZJ89_9EUPU|nr:unnamed protein product [Candidula unifasciata]